MFSEIIKFKDYYGNEVEVIQRSLEEGDLVVVLDERYGCLISSTKYERYIIGEVKSVLEDGDRVNIKFLGNWSSHLVYQVMDLKEEDVVFKVKD